MNMNILRWGIHVLHGLVPNLKRKTLKSEIEVSDLMFKRFYPTQDGLASIG